MTLLKEYTLDMYEYVNEYLRNDRGESENYSVNDMEYYDNIIDDIDDNMSYNNINNVLYRGLDREPEFGLQKHYTSCSKSLKVAMEHGMYVLVITVLGKSIASIDLENISYIADEKEVLLDRDVYLNQVGIPYEIDGIKYYNVICSKQ